MVKTCPISFRKCYEVLLFPHLIHFDYLPKGKRCKAVGHAAMMSQQFGVMQRDILPSIFACFSPPWGELCRSFRRLNLVMSTSVFGIGLATVIYESWHSLFNKLGNQNSFRHRCIWKKWTKSWPLCTLHFHLAIIDVTFFGELLRWKIPGISQNSILLGKSLIIIVEFLFF